MKEFQPQAINLKTSFKQEKKYTLEFWEFLKIPEWDVQMNH